MFPAAGCLTVRQLYRMTIQGPSSFVCAYNDGIPPVTLSPLARIDRAWLEFLLSQDVEIVTAGVTQVDFLTIQDAACTSNVQLRELQVPQSTLELFWFRPRGGEVKKYQNLSLEALFDSFHGSTCIDPRDKVYGLLGLCEDNYKFPIDYSKSVQDVFLDATMALCTAYWSTKAAVIEESKTIGLKDYKRSALMLGTKETFEDLPDTERAFRAWILWRHRATDMIIDVQENFLRFRCTPVNHRLYHRILCLLSKEMIHDTSQLKAMHSLLWAIWRPVGRETFDAYGYPECPLVKAMGFDEARDIRSSHKSLQERIERDPAR
ncbi:hypothetical protein IQ06DRAFT_375942 [Phaeosphaeriaceae sp. SRC1lsM3a]|nr:hypothetical protein IQ06DRAFT_375942 [Stagonospora sp. SRC1lsM3a]